VDMDYNWDTWVVAALEEEVENMVEHTQTTAVDGIAAGKAAG
jgi:hypothetical protein